MEANLKTGVLRVEGQVEFQRRLWNYLSGGRLHSAILLSGGSADTKLALAKSVAKFLLCRNRSASAPFCETCSPCLRIEKNLHPDVMLYVEPEEEHIKIDTIREICHQMDLSPLEGRAKICIIAECQRMTTASANAFLKTLEEPRDNRFFWLLSNQVGSLPATLLSRCLSFSLKPEAPVPDEATQRSYIEWLNELKLSRHFPTFLSHFSQRDTCVSFVQFELERIRGEAIQGVKSPDIYAKMAQFESLVEIEGRLRSNANPSILLEGYARRFVL